MSGYQAPILMTLSSPTAEGFLVPQALATTASMAASAAMSARVVRRRMTPPGINLSSVQFTRRILILRKHRWQWLVTYAITADSRRGTGRDSTAAP